MRHLFFTFIVFSLLFCSCRSSESNSSMDNNSGNTLEGRWSFQGVSWDSAGNSAPGLAALAWLNVLSDNNRLILRGDSFQWVSGEEKGLNGHYTVHTDSLYLEYKNKTEAFRMQEKSDSVMVLQNAEGGRLQLKKVANQ